MEHINIEEATWKDVYKALKALTKVGWAVVKARTKQRLRDLFTAIRKMVTKSVEYLDKGMHYLVYHPWIVVALLAAVVAYQGLCLMQDAVERNTDSLRIYQLETQVDRYQMKYYRLSK